MHFGNVLLFCITGGLMCSMLNFTDEEIFTAFFFFLLNSDFIYYQKV